MRNFDTELDTAGVARMTVRTDQRQVVVIDSTVSVTVQPSASRAFLAKEPEAWQWTDLRDYVVTQIEQRFGVFPRDARKESGIFKSFLNRYGDKAPAVARYAFEVSNGYWAGAPISVNRFCKGSDPFFADRIVERLVDSPVVGW